MLFFCIYKCDFIIFYVIGEGICVLCEVYIFISDMIMFEIVFCIDSNIAIAKCIFFPCASVSFTLGNCRGSN